MTKKITKKFPASGRKRNKKKHFPIRLTKLHKSLLQQVEWVTKRKTLPNTNKKIA